MANKIVWENMYPRSRCFEDELVNELNLFSRYRRAVELLKESDTEDQLDWISPTLPSEADLQRCCSPNRIYKLLGNPPSIPPESPELHADLVGVGGTLAATDRILQQEDCIHIGGGFHHAHRGGSSDRSTFNDIVLAVDRLLERFETVAIIDLDCHFPDGTRREIRLDGRVYQFSIHGWGIFPNSGWIHETGSGHAEGNHLNMPLPENTVGRQYLAVLNRLLPAWLNSVDPDVVVYVAGADIHYADQLGNLAVDTDAIRQRDRIVKDCTQDIPVLTVMGGGYGPAAELIHSNTAAILSGLDESPGNLSEDRDKDRYRIESDLHLEATHSDIRRWLDDLLQYYSTNYPGIV